jgi:hypothetical protein
MFPPLSISSWNVRISNLAPSSLRARSRSSEKLELASFVTEGLCRPSNIPISFRLDGGLVGYTCFSHELQLPDRASIPWSGSRIDN